MKNRNSMIAILVSILIISSLLITLPIAFSADENGEAGENTARDISQNLLIHYNFEGTDLATQLADKAGAVQTNLSAVKAGPSGDNALAGIGALPDSIMMDEAAIGATFKFENGTVTALKTGAAGALATGVTEDTVAIQQNDGTWYLRVKMPTDAGSTPLNVRKSPDGERPICLYYDASDKKMDVWVGQNGVNLATNMESAAMTFSAEEWLNLAVVRSYNTETQKYDHTFKYRQDGQADWTVGSSASYDSIATSNKVIVALFAECCNSQEALGNMTAGLTYDDVRFYSLALTNEELEAVIEDVTTVKIDPKYANSYIDENNNFAAFIDMTDTVRTTVDGTEDWTVADEAGAIGGKALYNLKKVDSGNVNGNGITVTFSVPANGYYSMWMRTKYPNVNTSSLHYSIDGGTAEVWDFGDEDDGAACYNSWQYFPMTKRQKGTYSDTTQQGSWSIANGDWRHAPNSVYLTAGEHSIKITAREIDANAGLGLYLDELVVTSYGYNDYNPNAFTIGEETNTAILETCKFCGTDIKHFIKDIYALKNITAESYFQSDVCATAQKWNGTLIETPEDTTPEETTPEETTPEETTPEETTPEETTPEVTTPEETTPEVTTPGEQGTEAKTNAATNAATEAPAADDGEGCSSSVLTVGALALILIPAAAVCICKKKED